jgi:hypothetical protein
MPVTAGQALAGTFTATPANPSGWAFALTTGTVLIEGSGGGGTPGDYTKAETDALLADKADASDVPVMASGTFATPAVPADGPAGQVPITFPAGLFSAPPAVTVSTNAGRLNIAVTSLTADGFTVVLDNWSGGNASAGEGYYIAVGS